MSMTQARLRESVLPAILTAAIAAVTVLAAIALHHSDGNRQRARRAQAQLQADTAVDQAFRAPLDRLEQLGLGIEVGGAPTPPQFKLLAAPLLRRPEVEAVGYIERVTEADRARWEREHGVGIQDITPSGPAPAARRPVHYAVAAVLSRTNASAGSDLATDPVRVAAMRRAERSGRIALTEPVPLIGAQAHGRRAVIAFQPAGEGRFTTSILGFDRLGGTLRAGLPTGTDLIIDDEGQPLVRVGDQGGPWSTRRLVLGGQALRVRTHVPEPSGSAADTIALIAGLLIALGVGAFALSARRREQDISAEVRTRLAERQAVEEDLHRERGFSATLLAATPDGFLAADDRGLIVVNDALCELTGYSRKELLGRRFPYGIWPEDVQPEARRLSDRVDEQGSAQMELTLRTRTGERIPVSVSASRVQGTHGNIDIAVVRDNSERAAAQAALAASQTALEELANASVDMVVRLSVAERIEWASPSAESVLGYPPDELVGRRFSQLFVGAGAGRLSTGLSLHHARHRDGSSIWVEAAISPTRDADGEVTGLRATLRDVTEREEARAALQQTEARYRMLARTLPDTIVFIVDRDRRFVVAEGGGLAGTGVTSDQIEGLTVEEVLTDPAEKSLIPLYDAVLAGRGGEVSHTSAGGREYLVRFVSLRDGGGDPDGALVVATDVTVLRESHVMESSRGRHA
jgi:PAS domain S-box-containing protein